MSVLSRTVLAAALLAVAPLASAATDSDTMTVSIIIQNSCTVTANDLDFGTQTDLTAAIPAATTVDINCTGIGAYDIDFDVGIGAGATFATRRMTQAAGAATIDYSLYRNATQTEVLGDGSGGTFMISGTSIGGAEIFPVYGLVAAGQNPKPADTYTDTVTATITF